MQYPTLYESSPDRQMVDVFKGYNHNRRIGDGEFYDMKNMTSDDYPVLSTRGKRGVYVTGESLGGMIAKDSLCYVDGGRFYINEYPVEDLELSEGPKQLVSMGAYVIILPDKKWVNTLDHSFGDMDAKVETTDAVTFTMCRLDGTDYGEVPTEEPENPKNMDLWIDTSTEPHALKQWSASSEMWVSIATTYIKIKSTGIGTPFEKYDGITISGLKDRVLTDADSGNAIPSVDTKDLAALEGAAVVWDKGTDYIIVVGLLDEIRTISDSITISREMPAVDYVVESGNRLWGCKYGPNNAGEVVNEIYCSKLGDFKNWNCFMSLSTDSYVASVGTDGPFTGAITHLGYPLFFKENCVHKVYGNYPANFQIQTTACRGVQAGCEKSLAIVNETLFYKSRSGVCGYDGSLPAEVSYALGNEAYSGAVGGALGNKYYISMQDGAGESHLFVYDVAKAMWHKEDNLAVEDFCACRGQMYAISGKNILKLLGGSEEQEQVEWMVQTGDIGISSPDMKYLSRVTMRMAMEPDAAVRIYARYDFSEVWELVCTLRGRSMRSFSVPIRPKRCDSLQLRIEGEGVAKIYAITKTIEGGSELS